MSIIGCAIGASAVHATTLPADFAETIISSSLNRPTAMRFAPDKRLFICEKGGSLRVVKNGQLLPVPFVTVNTEDYVERGLLGVAIDPNFATNRFVYVYYTVIDNPSDSNSTRHNRVSRFQASSANLDVAEPGSEQIVLELPTLSGPYHNGGSLGFGAGGKLLVGVGENDYRPNSQSMNTLLGKMLRLNPDGTIPTDNPFYNTTTGQNRAIWALGLRNPFTFAVQNSTNRVFINDVGAQFYEEINDGKAGANYGWPQSEGPWGVSGFTAPLFYYFHAQSDGCAITGGAFYNPKDSVFPSAFMGKYFYSDFCAGYIRVLDTETKTKAEFATGLASPVGLETGPDGALYYLTTGGADPNTGVLGRITYTRNLKPVVGDPASVTIKEGQNAVFEVQASGEGPFTYTWQRSNDGGLTFKDAGSATSTLTISNVQPSDSGAIVRAVVKNVYGSVTSRKATLTVIPNQAPIPQILTPTLSQKWKGNQIIKFSGGATDAEDGDLPASAFTWRIDFLHNSSSVPFIALQSGLKSGSFTTVNRGETSPNVAYRITLTVKDSLGAEGTVTRDIFPITANLTLQSNIPGASLTLDGQSVDNPSTTLGVAAMKHIITAPRTFESEGVTYTFQKWSDGGLRSHEINFPTTDTTLTAIYAGPTAATTASSGRS